MTPHRLRLDKRRKHSSRSGVGSVCVVGEAGIEYRFLSDAPPSLDNPVQAKEFREAVSGKAVLQAIACSRLGADAVLLCKLGADSQAEMLRASLARQAIRVGTIPSDPSTRTGVSVVIEGPGSEAVKSVFFGANGNVQASDVFRAAPEIAESRAVLVTLGISNESASAAVRLAAGSQRHVILDTGDTGEAKLLDPELLPLISLIRLRARDARVWSGGEAFDRDSARIAAERLSWRGARAVVIDAGREEKLLLEDERELHLPRYALEGASAVSPDLAEDVFSAALAVAMAEGRSISEAATFANAASALAAQGDAKAQSFPHRHDVIELLRRDGIDFESTIAA